MEYVEILRAKRILTWFTGVLVVGLIIEAISYYAGSHRNSNDGTLPFSFFTAAGSVAALIIATFVAPGLNSEAANTTALVWTRPAPRDAIAWRFIAVDIAAILAGYAIMLVAVLIGIAVVGGLPAIEFDAPTIPRYVLLGIGGALMWYAVISAAASRLPGRGPLFAGLAWGVFPVLAALVQWDFLPIWLHDVIYVLDYLNPMAWLGGTTPQGNSSIIPFDMWTRGLGETAIALALLVVSVRLWSTREA